ncbi:MAG: endopeptidase La [Acidobacteriota bacterium]
MSDSRNSTPIPEIVPAIRTLPVLPLRDLVLFPAITMPIAAGRAATLRAIEAAQKGDGLIFAATQRQNTDNVTAEGLYTIGTVAKIEQIQRALNGVQVILHGLERGIAMRLVENERGFFEAAVRDAEEMAPLDAEDTAFQGLYREARTRAAELAQRAGLSRDGVRQVLSSVDDPGRLADLVAGYLDLPSVERQALLETLSVEERLRRVLIAVEKQIEVIDAQEKVKNRVQEELGDRQREIYLREQLKAIRQELGDEEDGEDVDELRERLAELDLPADARKEVDRELKRLGRIGRESMESQVIRTFLETVAELPWNERSDENIDLEHAQGVLDADHYGLSDVKDRVLEFLAVRQLRLAAEENGEAASDAAASDEAVVETASVDEPLAGWDPELETEPAIATSGETSTETSTETSDDAKTKVRAPILLFVGPPGVGKTSLAKSIARATSREYVRISLGGARDEADIRGHRRTYVGAMPGRIIQGMKQAGTKNPVFLLDEIDKLGVSFQGDPASALLEVLDPAQNDSFTDHYLGLPFDLSEVMFVCTANFIHQIPAPLLDRMETVEFDGYTEREKKAIAEQYLIPRQLDQNGLDASQVSLADDALARTISEFTREAGVRQLEREIGKIMRKVARKIAGGDVTEMTVDAEAVDSLLGRPRVHPESMMEHDDVGVATAMYYTPVGGDIMFVEATVMPGKGRLELTGQLGDVMKESAQAAWSYARSHVEGLKLETDMFEHDVHIHVPAGAIPKDGPSAGVTMATALVSALTGRRVRHDLAMTGEITLSGRVLPIGGVKEKILGGVRAGIRTFVLPKRNLRDLEDLPADTREQIEVVGVSELGEVLALALHGTFENGRLLFAGQRAEDVAPLRQLEN